ncbi:MAG: GNAT family N-acetyltransferase [Ferruginibacter sp.]
MEHRFPLAIEGKHILLRKVEVTDAEDIFRWRSGAAGKFLRQPENYSVQSQIAWIKSRADSEINYMIIDKLTQQKVGFIGIYDVNHTDRVANVGRLLLDEVYLSRSNPYGLEAMLMMYDHVLNEMNFRKITGDILAINGAMVKLQIFLGMKQEGFLEKHVLINNNFEDLHIISIFKETFNGTYKKKIAFLLKNFNPA